MRTGKRNITSTAIFLFLAFLLSLNGLAQQNLPLGGWRMHLPYKKCKYVTGSATSIWAATDNGLFRLNKADNSLERITKIDGLSDLTITAIGYNAANDLLMVGYDNGNLDLIHGKQIVNIPDIKRAQIIGNKTIHNFYFVGNLAYVSTGFGIVVIDTQRDEVKDSYFIGPNGTNLEVFDIVSDGTTIYAATAAGVYFAPINDPFLSNYSTWSKFTNIPGGHSTSHFLAIDIFQNNLIVGYEPSYPILATNQAIAYRYDFATTTWNTLIDTLNTRDFYVFNNLLYIVDNYGIYVFSDVTTNYTSIYQGIDGAHPILPNRTYVDNSGVWEADTKYGLVKALNQAYGASYYPNGPASTSAYWMAEQDGKLLVVPGGHDDAWNNVYDKDGVSHFNSGTWDNLLPENFTALDTISDLLSSAIDPADPDHYWLSSWGWGVVEMNNGAVANVWDDNNSTLRPKVEYHWVGTDGLQYDDKGNLWVVNSHVTTALNVYKAGGTWQAFDFTGVIPIGTYVSELMITSKGQKWMILPRGGGMLVFDDRGTLSNTADDLKKRLSFTAGAGNIPGNEVYCMAEDQDGEIWIGTDKGIAVFYCADNIFTSSGCDAQQILIQQGAYTQILMETQVVTCIAVDGANRKWIGTESGGVFLMSADGQKELLHFTAENSPLLSDDITSMTIDQKTGEIYFGTSKGIISYQGDAIKGGDDMGDVFSFPNPVTHDYHGPIAIRGLVKGADVKIVDVSGNVIYKTTSLGGQAIWDGNNFQGERAASGVYLVFVVNEDGTEKAVTKILFIN